MVPLCFHLSRCHVFILYHRVSCHFEERDRSACWGGTCYQRHWEGLCKCLIGECLVPSAPEISFFTLTDSVNLTTCQIEGKQTGLKELLNEDVSILNTNFESWKLESLKKFKFLSFTVFYVNYGWGWKNTISQNAVQPIEFSLFHFL